MLHQLKIERPLMKDIEAIHQVFEQSITNAIEKEGLGEQKDGILSEIEDKKQLLNLALNADDSRVHFWIAKIKDEVVGTISFRPCSDLIKELTENQIKDVGELGTLYILPAYQGKGIASALIQTLVDFLHENGIQQFCLDSGYREAQKRWTRKFGTPYKIVEKYWGENNDHMIWLCDVKDYPPKALSTAFLIT